MSNRSVLHIAVRKDVPTLAQERKEFLTYCGLQGSELTTLNVMDTPDALKEGPEAYDAVVIGGSSDANVLDGEDAWPWLPNLQALVRRAWEKKIPTFASCFGYQVAVHELGGELGKIAEYAENNPSTKLQLTEQGRSHWLCEGVPKTFFGVSIHKYSASKLPEGVKVLVASEAYPWHAIAWDDHHFFATQFHPEMNREDVIERMSWYKDRYWDTPEAFEAAAAQVKDMPEANHLIRNFAKQYLS